MGRRRGKSYCLNIREKGGGKQGGLDAITVNRAGEKGRAEVQTKGPRIKKGRKSSFKNVSKGRIKRGVKEKESFQKPAITTPGHLKEKSRGNTELIAKTREAETECQSGEIRLSPRWLESLT